MKRMRIERVTLQAVTRTVARTLAALAVALGAGSAAAAERPLWELGLGAGALRLPHYRGSDQSHDWLLPVPYVVYRGEIFKADRDGARAVLFESERVDFDLSVSASAPTRSKDNEARRGMSDLSPTLEFGPKINLNLTRGSDWKLDLRAPVRAAFTLDGRPEMVGWTATPSINLDLPGRLGWNLGLQAGPVWGSRRWHAYFYDVPVALATPERPAYRSRGGYAGGQFTAALSRRFERTWAGLFVKYDTLQGAVIAASPLVRQRENLSIGAALVYVFAESSQRVASDD
ncbi:MipA/OmpV family protein [Methylibium sp.]|uniref:MipA/OmpV family protein n=1 Tax=Methylibium sp. TaxID=2067992 RepID=UPI00286C0006|nr:MipA/OmpV family protein [Methylibium sp.]